MKPLVYGSVCSGIEAATAAWKPLGWRASFFSEIEAFPRAVLQHRYKETPLHGDFTTIEEGDYDPIGLLVGGTPCQSFSVAGLRGGLDDERGNLALEYCRLAQRLRPDWLVWENVPGVFSVENGEAFRSILSGLSGADVAIPEGGWKNAGIVVSGESGYGLAWRVLDAQHVRVSGFPGAVPQRRRRVILVGYLGDWRRSAAVLFEPEGLRGDPPPRRRSAKGVAGTVDAGLGRRGQPEADRGQLIAMAHGQSGAEISTGHGPKLTCVHEAPIVAHSLRGEGFDESEDGTGRRTPIVPIAFHGAQDPDESEGVTHPVGRNGGLETCIAFGSKDHGADATDDVSPTLRAGGHDSSHANAGVPPAVAFSIMPMNSGKDYMARESDVAQPVLAAGPSAGNQGGDFIADSWAVRRLMPVECERLQGFEDGFTNIPWRGNPEAPDGPRYKAIGNSMAVNVMRWVGMRIDLCRAHWPEE